jgi:hypothetical protein
MEAEARHGLGKTMGRRFNRGDRQRRSCWCSPCSRLARRRLAVQIDDGGCDGSRLRKKYELGLWFTAAGLGEGRAEATPR